MNRERNALKAGIFIVLSVIAAVTAIVLIRGEGAGIAQVRTVTFSLQDDLGGLNAGDDVRIGGTKVGTVRDIRLEGLDSPAPKVIVSFSMPAKYVLREHADIGVQAGLTGPPNLNITSLGSGKALPDDAALAGTPDAKSVILATLKRVAPHLETIVQDVDTKTLPKLNETVESANALVKHVDAKIDTIVKEYDGVAKNAGDVLAEIRDIVGDGKTDLKGTLKNLNLATTSIREKLPGLIDRITAIVDKVDGAVNSARTALADVEKTAANAREITGSARSLLADNRTRLDNIVKGLKATSDNLKAVSIEVRHSPWRLLYKPTPDEMANLNLYDSARQFAEGAGALSDAATALRDAVHDPNADKAQLQKLIDHLDESFKKFHTAEDKLWTTVKE